MTVFDDHISKALGEDLKPRIAVRETGAAELPSCFAVTDLAVATIKAATAEVAALVHAADAAVDRRRSALWYDMTLRPTTWTLPSAWDAIAGVYQTTDGWIRLHTNAPHHRDAALRVLGVDADRAAVQDAVAAWAKTDLETAIVEHGGAAAEMRSAAEWAQHPQGQAVQQEPLIAWTRRAGRSATRNLQDIKVLDLTRVLAGPVATRLLAGYGARVLRIDPPTWDEPGVVPEVTLGKSCAGLDLKTATGRDTLLDLMSSADILVHGYRPGALDALGLDAERRRAIAPDMIDISLCAYGWTGPWAQRRGFDSLVQMSCGIAHEGMQRYADDGPHPLPVQALDHATGYLMAAAALRALRIRNQTGQVSSARLSLARTAHLLMSAGARDPQGANIVEADTDLNEVHENTGWGPARRVAFPVHLDGRAPEWPHPAGPLRTHPAQW